MDGHLSSHCVCVCFTPADCRLSVGHCMSLWLVWRRGRESWRWRRGDWRGKWRRRGDCVSVWRGRGERRQRRQTTELSNRSLTKPCSECCPIFTSTFLSPGGSFLLTGEAKCSTTAAGGGGEQNFAGEVGKSGGVSWGGWDGGRWSHDSVDWWKNVPPPSFSSPLPPSPPPPHSQLSQERSEYCAATDRLQGSLQRVMTELDSTLTELEGTRTNNMLLKQQVRGCLALGGVVLAGLRVPCGSNRSSSCVAFHPIVSPSLSLSSSFPLFLLSSLPPSLSLLPLRYQTWRARCLA